MVQDLFDISSGREGRFPEVMGVSPQAIEPHSRSPLSVVCS